MDWRNDRIGSAARGENPTVIAELTSGFAVIGDVQFLPGYCVLLGRDPRARSLADMPRRERVQFLADADLLATTVEQSCREIDADFRRINLEILGNTDAFVHAHVWPRYQWEPEHLVPKPVWHYDPSNWSNPATALGPEHAQLRSRITETVRTLAAHDDVHIG
ncbi:HIT family protein [Paramicrobacterium fandaimingii]|uniref:HIT family protein n=1 Tax=Paramicrobacterium fandaimingii TaxID=2708079 RepID=UPI0014202505|nr:diadenosine tetraphosphate hydrolase [Microbacterium fandaimingii]